MSEINVNRNLFILCYNNFDFPVLTFNLSRFVCHVVCLMPTWVAPQLCFLCDVVGLHAPYVWQLPESFSALCKWFIQHCTR